MVSACTAGKGTLASFVGKIFVVKCSTTNITNIYFPYENYPLYVKRASQGQIRVELALRIGLRYTVGGVVRGWFNIYSRSTMSRYDKNDRHVRKIALSAAS